MEKLKIEKLNSEVYGDRCFDIHIQPDRQEEVHDLLVTLPYTHIITREGRTCVRVWVSVLADDSEIEEMRSLINDLVKEE